MIDRVQLMGDKPKTTVSFCTRFAYVLTQIVYAIKENTGTENIYLYSITLLMNTLHLKTQNNIYDWQGI